MRLYSILFNFIQFYSISCCRIINPQLILNDPIFFKHCGCNCFIVFHLIYPMISFTPWSHPQSVFTPKVSYDHPKNIMITWSHGEGFKGFEATEVRLYGSDVCRTHFESSSSFYNIFVNLLNRRHEFTNISYQPKMRTLDFSTPHSALPALSLKPLI